MELGNIELEKTIVNSNEQNNFLNSAFGKVVNNAIDIGIRYALPNFIENDVIDIKNVLFNNGLKEGINAAIQKAIEIGKSATGIVTGNFENVNQIETAVKAGKMIDSVSNVLDKVVDKAERKGSLNSSVSTLIKKGKDVILESLNTNLNNTLKEQSNGIDEIKKYSKIWKENLNNKNFEEMEKAFKIIEEKLNDLVPLEETIKTAREIEIIHNLIKNNGQNFNLTEDQIQTAINLSKY
ncbi:MAG: hypothetical protein IJV31_05865 [Clostridia bacterium]|nr:hypothetical protein [Clostridia bacterium]